MIFFCPTIQKQTKSENLILYICGLRARIECEPVSEHSTHSDRVTNIGYRFSSGASPLPTSNSYLILNIPSGFSKPHPCLLFAIPQSIALCIRRIFTSLFESHGSLERSKAIVPDTIGVAIEVPLLFL